MKVIIEGKTFNLNVEKAKELKVLTEDWKPVKLGDKFEISKRAYVLCSPKQGHILLIDYQNGCRWGDSVPVKKINKITQEEFDECCHGEQFAKRLT